MALLLAAGVLAGFIDSVIGGGGLITVPALMLHLGVSPWAIGTNKIGAAAATLAAITVYGVKRRMAWGPAIRFAVSVGLGAFCGASVSPRLLVPFYPVLLWLGAALCAATLLLKNKALNAPSSRAGKSNGAVSTLSLGLGFAVGFYDGAWGPGGGTFMFLVLLWTTPLGLVGSMAAAKIANFSSAVLSLSSYAWQGYVDWRLGSVFAVTLAGGAFLGARLAIDHAERFLTPLLLIIAALLLVKLVA
ncbi:MAG: TSUP family transporter [Elusimicrobia bacterium]|nr:TSUP family transporter [Elusimicrobiota bacterium]